MSQLETELRRRRPLTLSPTLVARIGRELAPAPVPPVRPRRRTWWWWALALPAAAAVGFALVRLGARPPVARPAPLPSLARTPATDVLAPVAMENVLYAAHNEGLVRLGDGSPARRQRLQFVDTIVWQNSASNVSVTWTLPREEVRVVRVVYQ